MKLLTVSLIIFSIFFVNILNAQYTPDIDVGNIVNDAMNDANIAVDSANDAIEVGNEAYKTGMDAGKKGFEIGMDAAEKAVKLSGQAADSGIEAGRKGFETGMNAADQAMKMANQVTSDSLKLTESILDEVMPKVDMIVQKSLKMSETAVKLSTYAVKSTKMVEAMTPKLNDIINSANALSKAAGNQELIQKEVQKILKNANGVLKRVEKVHQVSVYTRDVMKKFVPNLENIMKNAQFTTEKTSNLVKTIKTK